MLIYDPWVKVYEIVKTENSLKARNQLYLICKYYSNFFKQNSVLKWKTFTHEDQIIATYTSTCKKVLIKVRVIF